MIEPTDVGYHPILVVRTFAARFRDDGMGWGGALDALSAMVKEACRLADLYEDRTSHLEDVIEERNRYHDEAATLRRAIGTRFTEET